MAATTEEKPERITSEAQDEYAKFEKKMQAGGAHAQPPSSGSSDGGKGKDDKSGSSGGGGGKSGSSSSSSDDEKKNMRKFILVAFIVVSCVAVLIPLSAMFTAVKSTSPEGMAQTDRILAYSIREQEMKHEEAMKQLAIKEARLSGNQQKLPNSVAALPCRDPTEMTSYWSAPVKISAGQCVKMSSSVMKEFWITLASKPTKVVGKASFAEAKRPLSIEEKLEGKKKCIASGTDEATCDLDAQKPRGIWVDDCVTKQTADSCLGYLQSKKLGTSIHVYAMDVEIQTN